MNNVNNLNRVDANQNKSSSFSKFTQVLALCTILNIANPAEINATNITDKSLQNIEIVQNSDVISNIQRRTGVSLPNLYLQEVQNFILNDNVMKDSGILKYTEDFIVKQMQSDRGISKQNQLLFIRSAIYNKIMKKSLYNGNTGDGNAKRGDEYEDALEYIVDCGQRYKDGLLSYMNQRSADADRRSADADRRSTDADRRSAELTSTGLNQLLRFYDLYKRNPRSVKSEELKEMKDYAKYVVQNCKQYNIDYKIKLSPEVCKFYSIK